MLQVLDIFMTLFHTAFVGFVLSGWAFKKTRKAHLTALLLTLVAWLLIGLYKGHIGYCPLTDWHWDIKRALGENSMPSSFIEYLVESALGINFPGKLIDAFSVLGLVFAIGMATYYQRKEGLNKENISQSQVVKKLS